MIDIDSELTNLEEALGRQIVGAERTQFDAWLASSAAAASASARIVSDAVNSLRHSVPVAP